MSYHPGIRDNINRIVRQAARVGVGSRKRRIVKLTSRFHKAPKVLDEKVKQHIAAFNEKHGIHRRPKLVKDKPKKVSLPKLDFMKSDA